MKKINCFLVCLLFLCMGNCISAHAQEMVTINTTNFPDANFLKYVSEKMDTNQNMQLEPAECDAVTCITTGLASYSVTNFKGIEYFNNLEKLRIDEIAYSSDEDIDIYRKEGSVKIDVSRNSKIKEVIINAGQIEGLDLTYLPELESLSVTGFCQNALNLSQCKKIKKVNIIGHAAKSKTDISNSLTDMPLLESLTLDHTNVDKVDLPSCKQLRYVSLSGNKQCRMVNLSKSTKLKEFSANMENINNINLSGCCSLKAIDVWKAGLNSLNIKGCKELRKLDCQANNLKKLDVKKLKKLTYLNCSDNKIKKLNVNGCSKLKELLCKNNRLIKLNLRQCKKLSSLDYSNNKLKKKNISYPKLLNS